MADDLKEGIDYIVNKNGLLEFTKAYHLKRGKCCGNACKNCPYSWENVPNHKNRSKF